MDSAKKKREKFFLDRFLELQGISPAFIQPSDPPDFLIDLEGRKVGIEVTELFIRSYNLEAHPLQVIESVTNQIVSKAREIYFDSDNPPVLSTIVFSNRITPDSRRDEIAKLIADKIRKMNLSNSQVADWRPNENENEECVLSESVSLIHTRRVPDLRFARWNVARAGLVAGLTPKHLQEVIDKKAEKISAYKKYAEEIWLLIVADRTRPSQKFFVTPDFPLDLVTSPFTKTYFCSYVAEEVIDLTNKVKTSSAIF